MYKKAQDQIQTLHYVPPPHKTDTLTGVLYSSVLGCTRGQKNPNFENLLLISENNFHPN